MMNVPARPASACFMCLIDVLSRKLIHSPQAALRVDGNTLGCYSFCSESAARSQPHTAFTGGCAGSGYQPQFRTKFLSMDIVHQLGELFLGALPTVVLILIF